MILNLYIKNNDSKCKLSSVTLKADDADKDFLHNLCIGNTLSIENPAITFKTKSESGEFINIPENQIIYEAEICNILHDELFIRNDKTGFINLNIFLLFTRLIEKYIQKYEECEELKEYIATNI